MNIEQLRMFLMVSELGSFQKAAQHDFISQRAVSKQMKRLEDELGVPLFIRDKNKIKLTNAGNLFQQRCLRILQMINKTNTDLHNLQNTNSDHLKIGYFSPFDATLMRIILKKMNTPVTLSTTEEGVEHLITDVLIGNLDCAFIMDNYGFDQKLNETGISATIVDHDNMLIGINDNLINDSSVSTSLIKHYPVIYYSNEESDYLQRAFIQSLGKLGRAINIHRVYSYEQMQMLVSLGQAISFYPANLVHYLRNPSEEIAYRPLKNGKNQDFTFKLIYLNKNDSRPLKEFVASSNDVF